MYGYTSFKVDVTNAVIFGEENALAVRVDQRPWESRWYPGAGIYRNVRLVVKNNTSFEYNSAFLTTPLVNEDNATVSIIANVNNSRDDLFAQIVITDENLAEVASVSVPVTDGKIAAELSIDAPKLWSNTSPTLYNASLTLMDGDKLLDNEISDQMSKDGGETTKFLADIVHREDPSRKVTAGINHDEARKNGIIAELDIVGYNYRPIRYADYHKYTSEIFYASETASAVSSRGIYYIPEKKAVLADEKPRNYNELLEYQQSAYLRYDYVEIPVRKHPDNQVNSYDLSATDLEIFSSPYRDAFSGMAVGIFRTLKNESGDMILTVSADDIASASVKVTSKNL